MLVHPPSVPPSGHQHMAEQLRGLGVDDEEAIETMASDSWTPLDATKGQAISLTPSSSSASLLGRQSLTTEQMRRPDSVTVNGDGNTRSRSSGASWDFFNTLNNSSSSSGLPSRLRDSSSSSLSSLASTSGLDIAPAIFTAVDELRDSSSDGALIISYVEVPSSSTANASPTDSPVLEQSSSFPSIPSFTISTDSIGASAAKKQFRFEVAARCDDSDVIEAARYAASSKADQPQGLVIKVVGRTLLCHVLPSTLTGVRRARALVHGRNLLSALSGSYDAATTVSSPAEVTLKRVLAELNIAPQAYADHRLANAFPSIKAPPPCAKNDDGGNDDAPPPLPSKDGRTSIVASPGAFNGLASSPQPQVQLSPSLSATAAHQQSPLARSPIVATNDLRDLQDQWSQSNASVRLGSFESLSEADSVAARAAATAGNDGCRSSSRSSSSRSELTVAAATAAAAAARPRSRSSQSSQSALRDDDGRSSVASRTPSPLARPRSQTSTILPYDASQEIVFKKPQPYQPQQHPIDKELPVVMEKGESIAGRSSTASRSLPRTPATGTSLSSMRSGLSEHASKALPPVDTLLSMPNPHSRKESMWHRPSPTTSTDINDEEERRLQRERDDFLRFQEAEKARVAELEKEDERRRQRRKQREDEKRRQDVLKRLEAEQHAKQKRGSPTKLGPPPSEPLPTAPPKPASTLASKKSFSSTAGGGGAPSTVASPRSRTKQLASGREPRRSSSADDGNTKKAKHRPEPLKLASSNMPAATAAGGIRSPGGSSSLDAAFIASAESNRKHAGKDAHLVSAFSPDSTASKTTTSNGSPADFTQALLSARRERRAIREEGSSDGLSWISKHGSRNLGPRQVRGEDEFEDLKAMPKATFRPFHEGSERGSVQFSMVSAGGTSIILADKDLPVPPPLSPEAVKTLFAQRKGADSPSAKEEGAAGSLPASASQLLSHGELADEARRRALAAEQAALEQIKVARALQKRLEFELSEVTRRERERGDAEAAARAKWAREQAKRNALDAFERSKLEHEERTRRLRVQSQQQEESRRAEQVKVEKERAEQQEREAIEEARRRKVDWQRREEKLVEEEGEARRREEEKRERKRKVEEKRQEAKEEMRARMQDGEALLEGLARAQMGESRPWRTRYFELREDGLLFFKEDKHRIENQTKGLPAERLEFWRLIDRRVQDDFEMVQAPHSCVLLFEDEDDNGTMEVTIAFPNEEVKEKFVAGFELAVGNQATTKATGAVAAAGK